MFLSGQLLIQLLRIQFNNVCHMLSMIFLRPIPRSSYVKGEITDKNIKFILNYVPDFACEFNPLMLVCLCWGFTARSTQWGHVERGQFTYPHVYWAGLVL